MVVVAAPPPQGAVTALSSLFFVAPQPPEVAGLFVGEIEATLLLSSWFDEKLLLPVFAPQVDDAIAAVADTVFQVMLLLLLLFFFGLALQAGADDRVAATVVVV